MYDKCMTSIREKIARMFIMGLSGDSLAENPNMLSMLRSGLGGVIFFTENITSKQGFKKLVSDIKKEAKYPLFLSIDQEGGRVERTLNLYGGSHYKSAREAAKLGPDFVREQTSQIAHELKDFGLNMNFAPVLDVDTNPLNPVIAERSYSSFPDEVVKYGKIAADTYLQYGIVPVGKHFPGHGETSVDSHKDMPELAMTFAELENTHIYPFKELVDIPALMVAHIHYTCFDEEKIPASVSENVIKNYLRAKLGYEGLVISDDMVMGGIKGFSPLEACKRGIKAGINMFIYRSSDDETVALVDKLTTEAEAGKIDISDIEYSYKKITAAKSMLQ